MGWCWSEGSIWSFKSCSCRITRSQPRKQSTVGAVGMEGVGSGLKFRSSSWVPATLTGRTLIPVPSLSTQDLAAFLQTAPTVSRRRQRRVSLWSHHSPRGIRQTLPHQLRLPLCPCQLFLKLLEQASLFAVTILFLLEMKDTIRDKRFVGYCSCGSKDITRTPQVSIPDIFPPPGFPGSWQNPLDPLQNDYVRVSRGSSPKLCTLPSSLGNSRAHWSLGGSTLGAPGYSEGFGCQLFQRDQPGLSSSASLVDPPRWKHEVSSALPGFRGYELQLWIISKLLTSPHLGLAKECRHSLLTYPETKHWSCLHFENT